MDWSAMDLPTQAKKITLTFYDGRTRQVGILPTAFAYPAGHLMIIRTDLTGKITYTNSVFNVLTGYDSATVIGQPCQVIRHPDMPKAIFQSLWESVLQAERWHGYVKNLRRDGRYFWSYMTVTANQHDGEIVGFTSIHRQASEEKMTEISKSYQRMLAEERNPL